MKINQQFLYRYDGVVVSPLTISEGDGTLTLTKGDKYEHWHRMLALSDKVNGPCGAPSMMMDNRRLLFEVIEAWLDGEEYDVSWYEQGDAREAGN